MKIVGKEISTTTLGVISALMVTGAFFAWFLFSREDAQDPLFSVEPSKLSFGGEYGGSFFQYLVHLVGVRDGN
jgi:hypothetical protein